MLALAITHDEADPQELMSEKVAGVKDRDVLALFMAAQDFRTSLDASEPAELKALRHDVEAFSMQFPTIGFDKATMRYKD